MAITGNTASITFAIKPEIKELIMHTAERANIDLNQMYQTLLIEALAARSRKKRGTNNIY